MKIFLTILFVYLTSILNAQISLQSVNDNIVYLGLENKLKIKSKSDLTFITTNGEIKKGENGYYYYIPEELGFPSIYIMGDGEESIDLKLQVIDIPKPQALFESDNILPRIDNKYIDRNNYTKERIKKFLGVSTFISNFKLDVRMTVVSYQLQYLNSKNSTVQTLSIDNYNFYLNDQIKQIVDNCNPGDIFMISKILSDNNVNGNLKYLDSIYFMVAE